MEIINILKGLGVIGTGGSPYNSLVRKPDDVRFQNNNLSDFLKAGQVEGPDVWQQYNLASRRPVTLESQIRLYDEMSNWDLMAAILCEVVEEATQTDNTNPNMLWYECIDKSVESSLNKMLEHIRVEDIIPSQVHHIAAFGNSFDKIEYSVGEGVTGLSYVHPIEVKRYWLKKNRKCIGFSWDGNTPDNEAAFFDSSNNEIPRVSFAGSGTDVSRLFYPWDFLHLRRMHRTRSTEHGEPIFNDAQGIYKKLRMALDQMTVHRAQVQPDRYALSINCAGQSVIEQYKTVQRMKQSLRSKQSYTDPRSGFSGESTSTENPTGFSSFYSPWALDTIFCVPQVDGREHAITKLQGTQNIPDVYDIEMLLDLFYDIVGVPRNWFSNKEGGENPPSGKALLAQDMKFLRKIKSIRKPIIQGYTWLGKFHNSLLTRSNNGVDLDIRAVMPQIGGLEDQLRLEMLKTNAELLDLLADIMDKYNLPREAWVEVIFDKYLKLPRDIIDVFITALPAELELEDSFQRSPRGNSQVALNEVKKALGSGIGKSLASSLTRTVRSYMNLDDSIHSKSVKFTCVMHDTRISRGDIIVMGDVDLKVSETVEDVPEKISIKGELLNESSGSKKSESSGSKKSEDNDEKSYIKYFR